jgi:hypothetical protein
MYPLALSFPALAVSAIYCLWQTYQKARLRQEDLLRGRVLRERVACLLWAAADLPDVPGQAGIRRCAPGDPTPLWQPRCPLLLLRPRNLRRQA